MKTLITSLLCTVTLNLAAIGPTDQRTITRGLDATMRPCGPELAVFNQVVRPTAHGYEVTVRDAQGVIRTTGTYLDAELTQPQGTFHYYHANGQLESTGSYVQGRKTGVWQRFDSQGRPLSERVYGTTDPEQLALELGWMSKAENLGDQ